MSTNLRLIAVSIRTIRLRRCILLLVLLCGAVLGMHTACAATRRLAAGEFAALAPEEQRSILGAALRKWLRSTENIHVKSESRFTVVGFHDGIVARSELIRDRARYECDLRRLAPDYFAATKWYLREQGSERLLFDNKTTLDSRTGAVRMYSFDTQLSTHWGAIDTEMDKLTEAHRYCHWFGGDFDVEFSFPILFLLDHLDAIVFEGVDHGGRTVRMSLTVDYPPNHRNVRSVWIDPERGYFPVGIHYRLEETKAYEGILAVVGDGWFTEYRTDVLEMRRLEDFWIPWQFEEVICGSYSASKGESNLWVTVVSDAQAGVMTSGMLSVEFPPGTKIHDRIRGEFIGFESPNTVTKSKEDLTTTTPRGSWSWLIALHGILLGGVAVWFLRRRAASVSRHPRP